MRKIRGRSAPAGHVPRFPGPMQVIGRSALTIFHGKIVRARLTP
jgi:hypothetical protein